jgi:hypothetical protein
MGRNLLIRPGSSCPRSIPETPRRYPQIELRQREDPDPQARRHRSRARERRQQRQTATFGKQRYRTYDMCADLCTKASQ